MMRAAQRLPIAGANGLARRLRGPWLLAIPGAAFMVLFLIVPLVFLGLTSFWRSAFFETTISWNLEQYADVLSTGGVRTTLLRSVSNGAIVAIVCVVLAFPLAWYLRFKTGTLRILVLGLVVTALFSGYLVRIYAWRTLLGSEGALNSALQGLGLIDSPSLVFFYNRFAVILSLVHVFLPFAVLMIFAALEGVDRQVVEAARTLGAGWRQVLGRVVLPIASRGLFSAFAFILILAAGDYVAPSLVGGTSGSMVGQQIALQFVQNGDYSQGAALSFVFMLAVLAAVGIAYAGGRLAYRMYR
jgi:spermidine/putrescine transport system permease protein